MCGAFELLTQGAHLAADSQPSDEPFTNSKKSEKDCKCRWDFGNECVTAREKREMCEMRNGGLTFLFSCYMIALSCRLTKA